MSINEPRSEDNEEQSGVVEAGWAAFLRPARCWVTRGIVSIVSSSCTTPVVNWPAKFHINQGRGLSPLSQGRGEAPCIRSIAHRLNIVSASSSPVSSRSRHRSHSGLWVLICAILCARPYRANDPETRRLRLFGYRSRTEVAPFAVPIAMLVLSC